MSKLTSKTGKKSPGREHRDFYKVEVSAVATYLADASDPNIDKYTFSYAIKIENRGTVSAKLISRHWIITDANCKVQEVQGEGVIGKQPFLLPGDIYEYTSFAMLKTPVGSMHGSYTMIADDGEEFAANIPPFSLAIPTLVN